jgi:hypothetical protein
MKCPYPDCPGEISEGEQFCGECGRSLAPEAVAAARAGLATNPLTTTPLPPPPPVTQSMPAVGPAPPPVLPAVAPTVTAPVARGNNTLPWIVIGVLGLAALSVVCCLGVVFINPTIEATPTVPVPVAQTVGLNFDLSELTADNGFQVDKDVRAADDRKIGVVSLKTGYNYEQQGSPEIITTVEILVNNVLTLELAATNEAKYAETNPEFEVAEAGKTYTRTTADNLTLTVTVERVSVQENPRLANDSDGRQPAFTDLALVVNVTEP